MKAKKVPKPVSVVLGGKRCLSAKARVAVARAVDAVAYEILDQIVCPVVGIKGCWADVNQADITCYLSYDKRKAAKQRKEIITRIASRYGASEYMLANVWKKPLVHVALVAMGRGRYVTFKNGSKKGTPVPESDAWVHLAHEDERLRPAQVVRAKVVSVPRHGLHLKYGHHEIVVRAADVGWGSGVPPAKYAKVGEFLDVTILRQPVTDHSVRPWVTSPAAGWLPWPKAKLKRRVSRETLRKRAKATIMKKRAAAGKTGKKP